MAITQTITQLPPAPEASMEGAEFESHALAFVDAQDAFVNELNVLIPQINSTSSDINTKHGDVVTKHGQVMTAASQIDIDAAALSNAVTSAQSSASSASSSASSATTSKNAAATSATNAANSATTAAAVGTVIFYAKSTPPAGFLKANGAAVSRTTYAALYAVLGTVFGVGDGSTTFNLPDLRGEFLRGWDDARGVDNARVFGSWQADLLKAHSHGLSGAFDGTPLAGYMGGAYPVAGMYVNYNWSEGGVETRPRNVALLACIRF